MLYVALILSTIAACAHRTKLDVPTASRPTIRDTYSYNQIKDHVYVLQLSDGKYLKAAERELGCGVCRETILLVYVIEVFPQPKH